MAELAIIAGVVWALSVVILLVRDKVARPRALPEPRPAGDPEVGDVGVLRIVLDARVRAQLDEALARAGSIGSRSRALAKAVRAQRDAWRWAGAIDVEAGRLLDVPERLAPLLAGERQRLAILDDPREVPSEGPFRTRGGGDGREVVLVVFVLGVRESPVLRLIDKDTLVTVGEIGRGDTVAAALAALAELADAQVLGGEVFLRPEPPQTLRTGELARAYSGDELVALTA